MTDTPKPTTTPAAPAAAPAAVPDATPATKAQYVLLRGDTGELVAQGEFVPGRASLAYAPATPELEQHLMRLLEDRDPRTGAKRGGGFRRVSNPSNVVERAK